MQLQSVVQLGGRVLRAVAAAVGVDGQHIGGLIGRHVALSGMRMGIQKHLRAPTGCRKPGRAVRRAGQIVGEDQVLAVDGGRWVAHCCVF